MLPYEGEASLQQIFSHQQRVGSINFAAIYTRLDIAKSASRLAEFMTNPSPTHVTSIDRVIVYLASTKNLAIEYSRSTDGSNVFIASSDAAFTNNLVLRKSSNRYLF